MSNASLAIYLGESYTEIEARSVNATAPLLKKSFFLPQTSLKAILAGHIKPLIDSGHNFESVYIVTKYLDRLKSFRLGGSVIQILNAHQENNYTFEDSNNLSLAAASLIITLNTDFNIEILKSEIERVKKINPEANKVVLSLKDFSHEQIISIEHYLQESGFKVFTNTNPSSLNSLRRTLINAGTEGTKEEIVSEFKEALNNPKIYFWIHDKFNENLENIDLYFSADHFLNHLLTQNKKDILIHTDIERWTVIKNKFSDTWQSPWGKVDYKHVVAEAIGIHPFSEVRINQSGHLSFSKIPAAIEPGPMLAGRSVKALVIDAFYKIISESTNLSQLFPHIKQNTLMAKIESQFKVLENGQIHYDEPFNLQIIQDFIINKLGYDILLFKTKAEKLEWTGHLNILFERLDNEVQEFSWTQEIYKRI